MLAGTAGMLFAAAPAPGAVGELTYRDCITGEIDSSGAPAKRGATPTSGACVGIPTAISSGAEGFISGLGGARDIAVSPDGRSVYVTARSDDAIAHFTRVGGKLTYEGCLSGWDGTIGPGKTATATTEGAAKGGAGPPCTLIEGASLDGVNSGLDSVRELAISADGRSLYATAAGDDAVARFRRNRRSGELTYKGCITGEAETAAGPRCVGIPGATSTGLGSGLNFPTALTLRPGDEALYVGSTSDDAVAWFKRARSGALTFKRCVSSGGGAGACDGVAVGEVAAGGTMAPSADGKNLYSVGSSDLTRFALKRSGRPLWQDCLSGDEVSDCREIPSATPGATDSGFDGLSGLVVSPDDRWVYAGGENENAIARLRRNLDTGRLAWRDCLTATTETGPVMSGGSGACAALPTMAPEGEDSGFEELEGLEMSADGKSLYTTASRDASVGWLKRKQRTGELIFKGCISGDTDVGPAPAGSGACTAIPSASDGGNESGLDSARGITVSDDGRWLYATGAADDALARFRRER